MQNFTPSGLSEPQLWQRIAFLASQKTHILKPFALTNPREAHRVLSNVARQDAYEIAKAGGRHAGLFRTYQGKNLAEVQRALRSYERQVDLHQQKLSSPERFVKDWTKRSIRTQQGLLRHWQEDLVRNRELAEVMRGILQERSIRP